jgi:hypothetical protein
MHSIRDNGGPPNTWKPTLFAHIGGNEEFVIQLMSEMCELVDASMIYGDEREKLKEAILIISMEGLMPAFEHLKKIRALTGQEPELNRKQLYEDFTRSLWHAYKDLMQKAANMMEPEFGFLCQRDTQFEAGLATWAKTRPEMAAAAGPDLRRVRTEWQNELGAFRNYLEHKDDTDPKVYTHHYERAHAENIFDTVWRTIADILAMLISLHLPAGVRLMEIPPDQRTKVSPRRFCFDVEGITSLKKE